MKHLNRRTKGYREEKISRSNTIFEWCIFDVEPMVKACYGLSVLNIHERLAKIDSLIQSVRPLPLIKF